MLKFVHYVARTVGKRAVGIGLKCLLVVRCALPLPTEYSNTTVTLNTADTRYVHWRHIPRVEVKVKDNQYIYITYITITEQCMQRHVLMIPEDNVSQWTGTAGDNRSPQIIVIPVS